MGYSEDLDMTEEEYMSLWFDKLEVVEEKED